MSGPTSRPVAPTATFFLVTRRIVVSGVICILLFALAASYSYYPKTQPNSVDSGSITQTNARIGSSAEPNMTTLVQVVDKTESNGLGAVGGIDGLTNNAVVVDDSERAEGDGSSIGEDCCCKKFTRPETQKTYYLAAAIINRIWPLDLFHMGADELSQWIEYHRMVGIERFYWCDNIGSPEESTQPLLQKYIDAGIVYYILWPNSENYAHSRFGNRQMSDGTKDGLGKSLCLEVLFAKVGLRFLRGMAILMACARQVGCYEHIHRNVLQVDEVEWLLPFDMDEYMVPFAPILEYLEGLAERNNSNVSSWPLKCDDLCFTLAHYLANLAESYPKKKQWMFQNTVFHGGGFPDDNILLSKYVRRENKRGFDERTKAVIRVDSAKKFDVHSHIVRDGNTALLSKDIIRMHHYWGPRIQDFKFGYDDPKVVQMTEFDNSSLPHAAILRRRLDAHCI